MKSKILNYLFYSILISVTAIVVIQCVKRPLFASSIDVFTVDLMIYSSLLLITFGLILFFSLKNIIKSSKTLNIKIIISIVIIYLLLFTFIYTFLVSNIKSGDYNYFLSKWVDAYRNGSIKEAMNEILIVSNYAPAYNYFLIIISKINMYDLYLIKYLSLLFSILLAFVVAKIVMLIKKSSFNWLVFVIVLCLPSVMIEYSYWGQCDAIYTTFALFSFYFALRKKSKLSFLFLGLSLIFKLQTLFIVPILFIMLIIKTKENEHYLKFKDVWIVPLVYCLNFIPALFGESLLDLILVYYNQSQYDARICGACANLCSIAFALDVEPGTIIYKIVSIGCVLFTFAVLISYLIIIFKSNKIKRFELNDFLFWALNFSIIMVYCMPKMLDRFYFIASLLFLSYLLCNFNKKRLFMFVCFELGFLISMTLNAEFNNVIIAMLIVSVSLVMLNIEMFKKYIKPLFKAKTTDISNNTIPDND